MPITIDPHGSLIIFYMTVEAHALQKSMSHYFLSGDCHFVSPEVVKDRLEKVHAAILPKPAMMVECFVSKNISHRCKFVVGTDPVELAQIFEDFVSEGEVLLRDVF
jgi:hypothetical protein